MAYEKRLIKLEQQKRVYEILIGDGHDMRQAQRLIDKGRVLDKNGNVVREKNAVLKEIYLIDYKPNPKGLKPIFESENFAIFDKPSGVLSHPNGRHCKYSLNDEIQALWGKEACVAHRLDKETSGLIVIAKNRSSQIDLKMLFEHRKVKKSYLAIVKGKVDVENLIKNNIIIKSKNADFIVDAAMDIADDYDDFKMRMKILPNGKTAITEFKIINYNATSNTTLLEAFPLTGRQHQIRVHLFHIGHKILGEPLYGLKKSEICDILDENLNKAERINLTGATRLMLHAKSLEFEFMGQNFKFQSKAKFIFD